MPIKYYWVLIILGIAVGISGVIFNSGILKTQKMFKESKLNRYVKIMIPFFITGILRMITPILIASGYELIMELHGIIPSLKFNQLNIMPIKYYWVLIILGIAVGISGVIFNSGILKTQKMFKESKLNRYVKIMIPFFITGIIGMISPILIGGGHELIMELQSTDFMLITLMIFLVVKFIFTFICFGSGVPGGIFFPLLVLGALVGNIVGLVSIRYLGIPSIYIMNFVVLAMAGHFAAIVKAPITGIILISEMKGSL